MDTPAFVDVSGARAAGGRADACETLRLELLVAERARSVSRLLRRLGVRDGDVDDVAQRVFLTLARRLARVRPGAEEAFLYAIALREAGHQRRTYRRRREIGGELTEPSAPCEVRPDGLALRKEAHAAALAILAAMDESLRTVFVLSELQQASLREVAACLRIPLGTAKSRLRRARDAFEARARQHRHCAR